MDCLYANNMKICNLCGNYFPSRIEIDGRYVGLYKRKYCLDCSPFGGHNTTVPRQYPTWTKELLAELVPKSKSISDVIRRAGGKITGRQHSYVSKRVRQCELDTSHFSITNTGAHSPFKLSWEEVLTDRRSRVGNREKTVVLRQAMLESGIKYSCVECGLSGEWNSKPIVLQIDHKDGDAANNVRENLRFLCPNCHSQTETFGVKNRKT